MAEKTNTGKKEITILAGTAELRFAVGLNDFTSYQNEFMPNNKVAPSFNFVSQCAHTDDKDQVTELCDQGLAVELASLVADQFKPDIQLSVKK